ncbi:MAG: hydroxymethylbilane synthase [Armatimonadota bacterium]
MTRPIRLGTRGSALALAQSRWVAAEVEKLGVPVTLEIIRTIGDQVTDRPLEAIGVRGVFVKEIETALLTGAVDLAVHSMKDLPGEMTEGLTIAAVPPREDPRDVLVGRVAPTLDALPPGAVVGTSSLRRRAQMLAVRPDLQVADMRGNVDTRLRKLDEGQYDAICLAAAGLHRLGLGGRITQYFPTELMMPAVGQGALALQTRADDAELLAALTPMNDAATFNAVRAERAVLAELGGGCSLPLGALAVIDGELIDLHAVWYLPESQRMLRDHLISGESPEKIGKAMAERLLAAAKE